MLLNNYTLQETSPNPLTFITIPCQMEIVESREGIPNRSIINTCCILHTRWGHSRTVHLLRFHWNHTLLLLHSIYGLLLGYGRGHGYTIHSSGWGGRWREGSIFLLHGNRCCIHFIDSIHLVRWWWWWRRRHCYSINSLVLRWLGFTLYPLHCFNITTPTLSCMKNLIKQKENELRHRTVQDNTSKYLHISDGITSADGLYRKAASLEHLLQEFLFEKEPLHRLSSRGPLHLPVYVKNLEVAGATGPAIPERLKPIS